MQCTHVPGSSGHLSSLGRYDQVEVGRGDIDVNPNHCHRLERSCFRSYRRLGHLLCQPDCTLLFNLVESRDTTCPAHLCLWTQGFCSLRDAKCCIWQEHLHNSADPTILVARGTAIAHILQPNIITVCQVFPGISSPRRPPCHITHRSDWPSLLHPGLQEHLFRRPLH
jgi:hypothetical protein